MTPNEIRAELVRRGIRQSDIARTIKVTRAAVSHVIAGRTRAKRIRLLIAAAIERPVADVWPDMRSTSVARACVGGNA